MPSDEQLQAFLSLAEAERAEALAVAADVTGRPAHLLEKDTEQVVFSALRRRPGLQGRDIALQGV